MIKFFLQKENVGNYINQISKKSAKYYFEFIKTMKNLGLFDNKPQKKIIIPKKYPIRYYLHLTYNCNLNCQYCYNKDIRLKSGFAELPVREWQKIISKIMPYAEHIVLTGGESFLYKDINLRWFNSPTLWAGNKYVCKANST